MEGKKLWYLVNIDSDMIEDCYDSKESADALFNSLSNEERKDLKLIFEDDMEKEGYAI